MKKFARLMLCGLAAAALASGCSKKAETQETASQAETQEKAKADLGKVTNLGEYKGVEVERPSDEVTEEELEARIQSILDANPEYIEITDRPAKEGDIANIDYVGMKDGVAFDGGTAQGYDLELGSGTFIEGFEEGLIGASVGQELSLNLTFPENYGNTDLAGQAVVFDVTVNAIKEKKDAVLDDSFVQRMSDFNTVEEFREDTLADMKAERTRQAEEMLEQAAFQAALSNSEFQVNEAALEEQYNSQLEYYTSMVTMYGMEMKDYVGLFGMTEEEFQEQLRASAETAIRQQLLVRAIAEKEGLQVEDADREAVAQQYGMTVESMVNSYGQEAVDETAQMYRVFQFVKDNAVIKE